MLTYKHLDLMLRQTDCGETEFTTLGTQTSQKQDHRRRRLITSHASRLTPKPRRATYMLHPVQNDLHMNHKGWRI